VAGRRLGTSVLASTTLIVVAQLVGCSQGNTYIEPPPPEVVVTKPVLQGVTSYLEYTGTAQASERVELRARVKGFLKERAFHDGEDVKAGQLLFVIDEEPFQVRLDQAKAKQAEAEAALKKAEQSKAREVARAQLEVDLSQFELARIEESRTRTLLARNAGSREDLDRAEATRKKNEAQVEADRANLVQAEADYDVNILAAKSALAAAKSDVRNATIDLGYCRVVAPIDGKINQRELDIGNYVGDGTSTVLATIVKTDPIYAFITPSEDDMLRIQETLRSGDNAEAANEGDGASGLQSIRIEIGLGNETGYPHRGRVDYTDPSVDTGTGTIRVRGIFPNSDGAITPGLFVRARLPLERQESAVLVPDRALGSDQGGPYLLVVGKDDVVERRNVRPGDEVGELRVVEGQIGPDDRVVVEGLLRARPGLKVTPKAQEANAEQPGAVAANSTAAQEPVAASEVSSDNQAETASVSDSEASRAAPEATAATEPTIDARADKE
jgi:membrane fusion protein (multidrug efflux system)